MIVDKTNISHSYAEGVNDFEEWEHTYQEEQKEPNVFNEIMIFLAGLFFCGIIIPVFPATIIEAFFPEFPSYIVCFLLGLSLYGWLIYQTFHGDFNVAVSVGSNGIKFYTKSGKCSQYCIDQYVDTKLYRMKHRGGTIGYTFYINIRENNGENKAIPCNFLSDDDMGRLIKDLDRLKHPQPVQVQDYSSSTPYEADNVV